MYYQNMNLSQFALLVPMSVGLILGGIACQKNRSEIVDSENVIRIGEVSPMTGADAAAAAGTSVHRGVEHFIRQVNQTGGVNGKKLELVSLDDQGKPEQSAMAITKLITQKKVLAVIGTLSSSGSIAMAPIAQNHQVPLVTPTATHPKVTETGDFIFRACFTELFQGAVLARYAFQKMGVKKVTNHYAENQNSEQVREFIQSFKAAYGAAPDGPAALSYDAAALLVDAIRRVKNLTSPEVRNALSQTRNFKGVTGQVSFDAHRNPIKSAVIVQVEKGQFKYKMTLDP